MENEILKYRLVKKLPDLERGEVFTKIDGDEFSDTFYQSENIGDGGIPIVYTIKTIKANPDFFIDNDNNEYIPVETSSEEVELIKVKSIDQEKGTEFFFSVNIPKAFEYSKCKFCGTENIVWGITLKNKKKLPLRFNEDGTWIAHFSECKDIQEKNKQQTV